jgi:hypothetical protein
MGPSPSSADLIRASADPSLSPHPLPNPPPHAGEGTYFNPPPHAGEGRVGVPCRERAGVRGS